MECRKLTIVFAQMICTCHSCSLVLRTPSFSFFSIWGISFRRSLRFARDEFFKVFLCLRRSVGLLAALGKVSQLWNLADGSFRAALESDAPSLWPRDSERPAVPRARGPRLGRSVSLQLLHDNALRQVGDSVSCCAFLWVRVSRGSLSSSKPVGLYLLPRLGGFRPLSSQCPLGPAVSALFPGTPVIPLFGLVFPSCGSPRLYLGSFSVVSICRWDGAPRVDPSTSSPIPSCHLHFPLKPIQGV